MDQVQIFSGDNPQKLQRDVNVWLQERSDSINIRHIAVGGYMIVIFYTASVTVVNATPPFEPSLGSLSAGPQF